MSLDAFGLDLMIFCFVFFAAPSRIDSNRATLAFFGGRAFKARFLLPPPMPPMLYLLGLLLPIEDNGRLRGFFMIRCLFESDHPCEAIFWKVTKYNCSWPRELRSCASAKSRCWFVIALQIYFGALCLVFTRSSQSINLDPKRIPTGWTNFENKFGNGQNYCSTQHVQWRTTSSIKYDCVSNEI